MPVSDIERVASRIVWLIGARGDNFTSEVRDDRFIEQEIQTAIVETETEIVRDFAEAQHAARNDFLEWLPDGGMDSGDTVPAHIGQIEAVRVTPSVVVEESESESESESEDEFEDAILAEKTTAANIKMWRENHNEIFEDTDGHFDLTNETLEFTGGKAQVKIVSYAPDYATPALQISDEWEGVLVVGAIPKLAKIGVPTGMVSHYAGMYQNARMLIRQGLMAKPEIDVEQQRP